MKCIVIDDLPIALKGMSRLIHTRDELHLVGLYESAEEALSVINSSDIDLVFLDISLGGMSGMELAHILPSDIMVIFTTAYSEYAVESYDIDAIDYLVKPIDPAKFNRAVDKALACQRNRNAQKQLQQIALSDKDCINIRCERKYVRLKYDDILYVEGFGNTVIFHTDNEQISSRTTLQSIADSLPVTKFLRVNKSFIVNKSKITSFNNNDIFIGNTEISIGPKYRDPVMNYLLS